MESRSLIGWITYKGVRYRLRNPFSFLLQFKSWFDFEYERQIKGEDYLANKWYETVYSHDLEPCK